VSERGPELRDAIAAARERIGALAERLARARVRLNATSAVKPPAVPGPPPPFGGADARPIDDLELTFRAVDVGADVVGGGVAPDRGGASDQDKVR
jgi:hypothetical protein